MKKWLLWILCGVLCTCVVSCRRSDEWKLKVASLTLEYGEDPYADVKLQDVLEYSSGSDEREVIIVLLSAQGEKIDEEQASAMTPLAVGSYTLEFYCGEETEPLSLPVTIKDTVAPEFKDFKEKVSVDYGYDKDLTKLFSAEDLADVAIRIDGAVDTKKAGDYKVTVIAEDTSGNQTENECTITVKEKTAAGRSSSENAATSANVIGSDGSDPSKESADPPSSDVGSEPLDHDQAKCVIQEDQIGNTGKIFATQEEAIAWAENHIRADDAGGDGNITSYSYGGVHDSCGNLIGYTVGFTYEGWQLPAF